MSILSAINMAQLHVLSQSTGVPLYRLLGGKTRPRVKVYNTYIDGWLINDMKMGQDTSKIVKFFPDLGITGMKIYPFNEFSLWKVAVMSAGNLFRQQTLRKVLHGLNKYLKRPVIKWRS